MRIKTRDVSRLARPKVAGGSRGTFYRGLYIAIAIAAVFWIALGLLIWWLV